MVRLAPLAPIRVHALPFGELRGQEAPLTACAQQVQHRAEHFVQVHRRRLGAASNAAQQQLDLGKFLLADITGVGLSFHPAII